MENYDAILRTINDKIASGEKTIEWLREELSKSEKTISELVAKNGDLELSYCDATSTSNELTSENEQLRKRVEALMDEITGLKAANEALRAENSKLSNF